MLVLPKIKWGSTSSKQVGSIIDLITWNERGYFKLPCRIINPSFFLCFSSFLYQGLNWLKGEFSKKNSPKYWGLYPPPTTLWWIHPWKVVAHTDEATILEDKAGVRRGGGGGGANDYFWGLGELRQRFYPESPWFLVPISPQKSPLVPI